MDWLKNRFETARDAFTARRALVVGSIFACAAFVFQYAPRIKLGGAPMLLNVPALAWAVMAALLMTIYFLFEYAHRQRMALVPKIKVSFDQHEGGIVQTPIKFKTEAGQLVSETTSSFVRIKVETLSFLTVRGCSAFLTGIKKWKDGSFVPIPLSYAILLTNPEIDVPARVPRTIDFLHSLASDNRLRLAAAWPLTLRDAFEDHTTYRFIIAVNASNITSEIEVDVQWAGKWDAITAVQHK